MPLSREQRTDWLGSNQSCSLNNSQLVSIENENELNDLEDKLRGYGDKEYFIGLRESAGKWTWISNNRIEVKPKQKIWYGDLSGNEKCAKMFFKDNSLLYDDIHCNRKWMTVGYICERHINCQAEKGMQQTVNISVYQCYILKVS